MFCTLVKWCWWIMHERMQMKCIRLPAEVAGLWFLTHPPPPAPAHPLSAPPPTLSYIGGGLLLSLTPTDCFNWHRKVGVIHRNFGTTMQIRIQQSFVQARFFQNDPPPSLNPLQKKEKNLSNALTKAGFCISTQLPRLKSASSCIMCGKWQQLYAI